MSDAAIQVPEGLTTEGLLGRRYLARVIDTVLITVMALMVIAVEGALLPSLTGAVAQLFSLFLLLLLWISYGTFLESSSWQATLGKRWLGLRVYDASGGRLSPLQAAGRNLVKDGPFLLFQLFPAGRILAFILLAMHVVVLHRSPVYQAIHDRLAGTWVAAPEQTTQLRLS